MKKLPMQPRNILTIKTALKNAAATLKKAKIDSAWLDAELLLAFILGKDRSYILSHEDKLNTAQTNRFVKLIAARSKHTPLAYLVGYKEFYGLNFKVTKDTLVPRPLSERIVEQALPLITKTTTLIDIGTGSGCLIISILKNSKIKPKRAIAIDISTKTLSVAKQNAKTHKTKITFYKGSLLQPVLKQIKPNDNLLILANLPYVSNKQMSEPSIKQEPRRALYGGRDGLDYYRLLIKQIKTLQVKNITLITEMNAAQEKKFSQLF